MAYYIDTEPSLGGPKSEVGPSVEEVLHSHNIRPSLGLAGAFPVFFSSKGMPLWPVTLYVYESGVVSPSSSARTIQTYKEHLMNWLTYLEAVDVALEDADEEDLLRYRNGMHATVSSRTGRRIKASTINHRTASVARFYRWANGKGHFPSMLGDFVSTVGERGRSTSTPLPGSIRAIRGYRLKLRTAEAFPTIIRIDEFNKLVSAAPTTGEALAYRLMLASGLRRSEICGLNIGTIPDVSDHDPTLSPLVEISVRRKGAKVDKVKVPFGLIEELNWFILLERTLGKSAKSRRNEPLFVNKRNRRFQPNHFGSNLKRAAAEVGVECTCHSLRHTFAICVLKILQDAARRGAEINPLKVLQRLMGHAHAETTEIYLRALDVNSDEVVKALEYLYGATLETSSIEVSVW